MEDFEHVDKREVTNIMTEGLFTAFIGLNSPSIDNIVDWDAIFGPSLGTENEAAD